jgi:uncharacterized OB-fold protein
MLEKILRLFFRVPAKNPLTGDTLKQRMNESKCRRVGCVTIGGYYYYPQATCRRCGHRNHGVNSHVKEWNLPD